MTAISIQTRRGRRASVDSDILTASARVVGLYRSSSNGGLDGAFSKGELGGWISEVAVRLQSWADAKGPDEAVLRIPVACAAAEAVGHYLSSANSSTEDLAGSVLTTAADILGE